MKESYVFLAEGFEDIEAITVIDLLRRAEIPVSTVSITDKYEVVSTHGITMKADKLISEIDVANASWLILPGGMPGAENLFKCESLKKMLTEQAKSSDGRIAAVCASPAVVLGQMGLLQGEKATCYPGFEGLLAGAQYLNHPVVESGKFILGNGPANAMRWALSIIMADKGEATARRIADNLLFYPRSEAEVDYYFG